jgi:thioester reductase-like protein
MVAKYTLDLPVPSTNKLEPLDEGQTILLTGTAGSFGAYVLDLLCSSPRVKKVVALNRGEDGGRSRQPSVSTLRGLSTEFSKVDFVPVDISVPHLGLEPDTYNELLTTADRIIHNAWPVNFNISIASFEPHISGVRYLVDFAYAATNHIPIAFVSSISTVEGWTATGQVPE